MKEKIKSLVIDIIGKQRWRSLYRNLQSKFGGFKHISYAQEGEDLILMRYFQEKNNGFFIDVGAHHPQRFSNTCLFYKKGWRGINIDAMPGSMKAFNQLRSEDINLEIGIGESNTELEFYIFDEPALNSFDKELSFQRESQSDYKIIDIKKVQVYTLEAVLNKYLTKVKKIDFLTIDAEGLDIQVLQSNDWTKYQPEIILIELYNWDINHSINSYMDTIGYTFYAKTVNSVFFKRKSTPSS